MLWDTLTLPQTASAASACSFGRAVPRRYPRVFSWKQESDGLFKLYKLVLDDIPDDLRINAEVLVISTDLKESQFHQFQRNRVLRASSAGTRWKTL